MRSEDLKTERRRHGWGQVEAAKRLGVSQPYLHMLETGKRHLTPALARKVVVAYGLSPAELPLPEPFMPDRQVDSQRLVSYLAGLDYPGFAYVQPPVETKHPGEVLLTALAQESLEGRVAEALPWLVLHHWDTDSDWLVEKAKKFDLQNRLGFVVSLAYRLSEKTSETDRTSALSNLRATLDRSRLAHEDFFPRPARDNAEREWLRQNRPEDAEHWNLLSDLQPEHLQYVS